MPIFELAEWEVNTILRALGEQPYDEAATIIQHIKDQVDRKECAANALRTLMLDQHPLGPSTVGAMLQ